MKPFPSVLLMIAAIASAAGCEAPASRVDVAPRGPAWMDAGTPLPSVALKREVRYYVDETGAIWDDRGKKHDNMPSPIQ